MSAKTECEVCSGDLATAGEVFTFREGSMWIAAWRRYDVVAQGRNETEAVDRLRSQIASFAIIDAREGRAPLTSVTSPSPELLAYWTAEHAAAHPSTRLAGAIRSRSTRKL